MKAKLIKSFSLNDIAKAVNRDKTTIIKWESSGKIPPARRDEKGWRYYTEKEAEKIIRLAEKIKRQGSKDQKTKAAKRTVPKGQLFDSRLTKRVLRQMLRQSKTRKELADVIIEDKELHRQIVKLLISSLANKRK